MDKLMEIIISVMRYIAPAAAIFILFVCIASLFRNRPRVHTLARLVNQNDGSIINIDHWETSIGKSRSNDIVLKYPATARFHAVVAKKRRDWVLTNTTQKTLGFLGTLPFIGEPLEDFFAKRSREPADVFVNGQKIESSTVLENGDIVTIGRLPLKFECDEAIGAASRQEIRTAVRQQAPKTVAYGVLVDIKTKRPVYIKKKDVLIGRGNDCDIQIMSDAVSSNHARIHQTSRGWAVSDLDSHNGTKLNGRYINQPQLIFDEDMLTFGDKVFIFYEK